MRESLVQEYGDLTELNRDGNIRKFNGRDRLNGNHHLKGKTLLGADDRQCREKS